MGEIGAQGDKGAWHLYIWMVDKNPGGCTFCEEKDIHVFDWGSRALWATASSWIEFEYYGLYTLNIQGPLPYLTLLGVSCMYSFGKYNWTVHGGKKQQGSKTV